MAFNVNKFISHFDSHAGFARTSKFEVRIALPSTLMSMGTTEELALQCESAEIPGYTVNTVESKIFGAPTHIAATPAFGDITLNFICAGDLWEKKFFDAWLDLIIPKTTYLAKYKSDYQTTVTIHQFTDYVTSAPAGQQLTSPLQTSSLPINLTRTGNRESISQQPTAPDNPVAQKPSEIFACKLVNAFPITVNPMTLNWGSEDIHRLSVVFKYDKWLNLKSSDPVNLPPTQRTPGLDDGLQRNVRGSVVRI